MLTALRSEAWRRRGVWCRAIGAALLLVASLGPFPPLLATALLLVGFPLFLVGTCVWLVRDPEPWRRR